MTLGLAGAINRKIALVNFIQNQIMNTFRYGKMKTKKFFSPYSWSSKYYDNDSLGNSKKIGRKLHAALERKEEKL